MTVIFMIVCIHNTPSDVTLFSYHTYYLIVLHSVTHACAEI